MTKLIDQFFGKATEDHDDTIICGVQLTKQDLLDLQDIYDTVGYRVLVTLMKAMKQDAIENTLGSIGLEDPRIAERYKGAYLTIEKLLSLPAAVQDMIAVCAKNEYDDTKGVDTK